MASTANGLWSLRHRRAPRSWRMVATTLVTQARPRTTSATRTTACVLVDAWCLNRRVRDRVLCVRARARVCVPRCRPVQSRQVQAGVDVCKGRHHPCRGRGFVQGRRVQALPQAPGVIARSPSRGRTPLQNEDSPRSRHGAARSQHMLMHGTAVLRAHPVGQRHVLALLP